MKVALRTYRNTSPDLEDEDLSYDQAKRVKCLTVVRDAAEWTPIDRDINRISQLDIWAIDELHAFQMWLAYRRGEYTKSAR